MLIMNRLERVTHRNKKRSFVRSHVPHTRVRGGLRSVALIAATLAVTALPACAILEGPTPDAPKRELPAAPEVAPELISGGTAAENLPYFTEVLRSYTSGEGAIKGEPISRAVIDAGFDKNLMQVSFDTSKTGLEADNIFVSVRLQDSCLIGQVITSDRSFVAEVAPAVGPDNTLCLIGETAPIGW